MADIDDGADSTRGYKEDDSRQEDVQLEQQMATYRKRRGPVTLLSFEMR